MTLTQLREAYDAATRELAMSESYAQPIPATIHVMRELRRMAIQVDVPDVKLACVILGMKLADV